MAEKGDDHPGIETLLTARPANEGPVEAMHQVVRTELGQSLADASSLSARQYRVVMTTPSLRALAFEHIHAHQDAIAAGFATRLGADADSLKFHVLAATVASTTWTVLERWVAEGADPGRLVPMIDEGFACIEPAEPRAAAPALIGSPTQIPMSNCAVTGAGWLGSFSSASQRISAMSWTLTSSSLPWPFTPSSNIT